MDRQGRAIGPPFPYHSSMNLPLTRAPAKSRLLAPLALVFALVLLVEEWCWDAGSRLGSQVSRHVARWSWLGAVEARVRTLRPGWALCAFVLPGLLLFPVKILALVAIAHGHAASGIVTLVVAKLGGAAVVARLYALTLPTLLAVRWFAASHGWFMRLKVRCLARLYGSRAWLAAARLRHRLRQRLRRRRGRIVRALRRFAFQWRARRRPSNRNLP
jgi:hypothetical protein